MSCSLLKISGNPGRKLQEKDYSMWGELAGLKFFRLRHVKGFSTVPQRIRGFQGAHVVISGGERGQQRKFTAQFTIHPRTGEPGPCMRPLVFVPDPVTGRLEADCLDTEFNRKKIACQMPEKNNPFCEVVDPAVKAEIQKMSDEIEAEIESQKKNRKSVEEVNIELHDENQELRIKLAKLEREKEERQRQNEVIEESREKLRTQELKTTPDIIISEEKIKELKKEAREEIYDENAAKVKEIKEKRGKTWHLSKEFKQEISPLIDKRLQEKINADNSGDSN